MRRATLSLGLLLLVTGAALAQDMPLSQIIKEDEGWRALAKGFPAVDMLIDRGGGRIRVLHAKGEDLVTPDGQRKPNEDADPDVRHPQQVRTQGGQLFVIRGSDPPKLFGGTGKNARVLDLRGITRPAGLALTPDETTLVVGDAAGKYLWAFRIDKDGRLSAGEPYYPLRMKPGTKESGVTAVTADAQGRVYACTPLGVQIFDPTGRLCGVLHKPGPGNMTAIVFAGPDRQHLYVACGDTIYVREMLARGIGPK